MTNGDPQQPDPANEPDPKDTGATAELVTRYSKDDGLQETISADLIGTQAYATRRVGRLPEQFGRYKILKILGQGGMGAVYLAEDSQLDRRVAIKIPFMGDDDSSAVLDRFYREAKSLAAIVHPNICPIHEVGQAFDIHFIAMTYVEGKTLSEYIRPDKPLPIKQALVLVHKLASALHHAHAAGVIHRDLKPANIIINSLKEPVIMDFGLARHEGKSDAVVTQAGQMMGTPAYMPPEQFAGDVAAMGPGCDIYSLGVILYELLTTQRPFTGDVMAIMSKIARQMPPPPSQHRAEIDPQLDAICLRALAKRPADRFASMEEFTAALTDCLKARINRQPSAATSRKTGAAARGGTIQAGLSLDDRSVLGSAEPEPVASWTDAPEAPSTPADASSALSEMPEEIEAGTVLATGQGYRLIKQLGTGQYGEVWLGMAPGGIEVAIKKLLFPVGHKATQVELQALELMKRLRHSFLMQVQAYWVMEDQLLIVMELADGSLEDRHAECRRETGHGIPRAELFGYMREAAEAIDFLHKEQVLHRDIKPGNILLVKGHVKVADFGIATSGVMGADQLTTASATLGTPLYMSPELWNKQAGPRSDQYSLAVTYVELRLGTELAFDEHNRLILSMLPEKEQAVLSKALAPNPRDRFESCQQFSQALDEIVENEQRAVEDQVRHEQQQIEERRRRKRSRIFASLALLALLPAGWLVWLAMQRAAFQIPADCEPTAGATLTRVGGKLLYDRIERALPDGSRVELLLIPQKRSDDPDTFYCMRDKVSNRLFAAFVRDQPDKIDAESRWLEGAWPGEEKAAMDHLDHPVFSVSVTDADTFAAWFGGLLPTAKQWDKAAGRWDHEDAAEGRSYPEGPYLGSWKETTVAAEQIAINRLSEGPLPIGKAAQDIGPFGCRDMAGNGREWTRNLTEVGKTVPVPAPSGSDHVILRGRTYDGEIAWPLRYSDLEDEAFLETAPYQFDEDGPADVSFRCVIELPVD